MANILSDSAATFAADPQFVAKADGHIVTAEDWNELLAQHVHVNAWLHGGAVPAGLGLDSLTLSGAASFIQLGLTATSGNAQLRFSKGAANNQSFARWQSGDVTQWTAQHDSSENWNLLDGSGNVVLQLQQGGGVASQRFIRAANGVRIGSATGPLLLSGAGIPEGVLAAPLGSQYVQTDGEIGTARWRKRSGSGNTGWEIVPCLLSASGLAPTHNNTTTPLALISHTIPANTIADGRRIKFVCGGFYFNESASPANLTIEVRLNGNTLWSDTLSMAVTSGRLVHIEGMLTYGLDVADEASYQWLLGKCTIGGDTSAYGDLGTANLADVIIGGVGGEDNATALVFDVRITHGAADTGISFRPLGASLDLM